MKQNDPSQMRKLTTPEGVSLHLEVSPAADRASAFLIDMTIIIFVAIGMTLGLLLLFSTLKLAKVGLILVILLIFFLRNFYFIYFELKWAGRTPGKKKLGLRVIDRFGGHLTPKAVFARNMMREIEFFIPLMILFSTAYSPIERVNWIMAFIWGAILVLMPLFNKDKLRTGDLVGGTLVVKEPSLSLMKDIVEDAIKDHEAQSYTFTTEQLSVYGIHELQFLEELLRLKSKPGRQKRKTAFEAIAKKIGYQTDVPISNIDSFLNSYYKALRQHLEQSMLYGQKKLDKYDSDNT